MNEVMYALPEDLAQALRCKESYLRWAATAYGWRKARQGRRVRYHVEDAYRDLARGVLVRAHRRIRALTATAEAEEMARDQELYGDWGKTRQHKGA